MAIPVENMMDFLVSINLFVNSKTFSLIFPFVILKLQGISINVTTYVDILKSLFKRHQIGQLFSFSSVSWDKRIYILISSMFYVMQIYYNFVTCFKFIKNTNEIINRTFPKIWPK